MTTEESLREAEELLARLEAARGELDQLASRRAARPTARSRSCSELSELAKAVEEELERAKRVGGGGCPEALRSLRGLVEEDLDGLELWPQLHGQAESVRYSLTVGGKRVRPVIVLATAEAAGVEPERRCRPAARSSSCTRSRSSTTTCLRSTTTKSGAASRRRGSSYGEAVGILAGDALLAEAFRLATSYDTPHVARELAQATLGMIGGQYLDITGTAPDEATLHNLKTGALFTAAVGLGLWVARVPADDQNAWRAFGDELGLLFQIVDDILDGDGYVLTHGVEGARRFADEAAERARSVSTRSRGHERAARDRRRARRSHGVKKRLDVVLVERGLADSRAQAQALVMAGQVPGYDKPGQQIDEDAELAVERGPAYVSRGGDKLAHGLDALGVDPRGLDAIDVGASTGGFTDVLLQRGAARVIAVDVGYGQLHPRLRDDPRVVVLERTNARSLTELPFAPQLVVCDVSFISVRIALPPVLRLAAPGWQAVVLVKPQFEAGREDVGKGGVVRDPAVRARVLREIAEAALGWGASVVDVVDSGLPGPKGNRELLLHLTQADDPTLPDDFDERIDAAVAAG